MASMILDVQTLPEAVFSRISTEKVIFREENGSIVLKTNAIALPAILIIIPIILASCAAPHKEAFAQSGLHESYESPLPSSSRASESPPPPSSFESAPGSQMIAYSMSLSIVVKDTDEASKIILQSVKNCHGYIVQVSNSYITARIPQNNADRFINTSKALGKTERESKTGTDVTAQYKDNVIRLDNYKNVRDRYIALLEKAESVTDILTIEKELERIVFEIERLERSLKHTEKSVEYSLVSVHLREKTTLGPVGWVFYGLYHGVKLLFVW